MGGLEYHGKPLQADYIAAFEGDRIVAVAAHCWNGMVLVQAPVQVEGVARAAVEHSGRAVSGISGPAAQVGAARRALGMEHRPAPKLSHEELFALDLADLVLPPPLANGRWTCRRPRARRARAAHGLARGVFPHRAEAPGLRHECRADLRIIHELRSDWVLEDEGRPVAFSAFNARLPDIVQIGGVWTPPEQRGKGYGRAVVAGSLLDAQAEGVTRAVLFAEREDAKAAYRGIGFRAVGEFGLVLFG